MAAAAAAGAASASTALAANARHIAAFEAKPHPRALDESTVTEAFGSWAYPKIVAGLRSDNATVQAKSVVAARELLVAPERHIRCITAGITPALRDIVGDAAATEALQASAAATLALLVRREVGARDALQHGCLAPLLQLLKQPSAAVRDAAFGALQAAGPYEPWRAALTREGALPALLMYAQQEAPTRAAVALELLHGCAQAHHNEDALTQLVAVQQAVPKLCAMLESAPAPAVCMGSVRLLAALATSHPDVRTQAVDAGCVPGLLAHLGSPVAELAAAAGSALMMLTLAKEGKVAVHQAGGLRACLAILAAQLQLLQGGGDLVEAVTVNTLQTVTNSAEYPPCKDDLQRSPQLEVVARLKREAPSALVQAAAKQALRMAGVKEEDGATGAR